MKIKVLSDDVANKIAAGEVVERPVSVVRELVDNSLDAGSSDIAVYIKQGGKRLIRVVDDGCGMSRDDAILAFERHATSKISNAADLTQIKTFGFRGEALAAIASVSRIELLTGNVRVRIEGGRLLSVDDIPQIKGSDLSVEHLFFNTPARRKFLSSDKAEVEKIKTFIYQMGIAHHTVRFRLIVDGEEIINLHRAKNKGERARQLFSGTLCEVESNDISGLVGHPASVTKCKIGFTVLVNGRVVTDRLIVRAVRDGFDSMLKESEQPRGFICINVPFHEVDVNVHPQKLEVRFSNPNELFLRVKSAVADSLSQLIGRKPIAPIVKESPPVYQAESSFVAPQSPSPAERKDYLLEIPYDKLRYLGQYAKCFLLFEADEDLYIMDMHAAHERINFDKIRTSLNRSSQGVLISEEIACTGEELEKLKKVDVAGLELSFSENGVKLKAVPACVSHISPKIIISELLSALNSDGLFERYKSLEDRVAARLACHKSVRSGDELSKEEVFSLVNTSKDVLTRCPHGRPFWTRFSAEQVGRWFGR
jgi:DNA mismatch repair protein MutL